MRALPVGVTKQPSSWETPVGPIHGFDVYLNGVRIGWYRSMAPWRGYAWYAPNGEHGTVHTAREAVAALLEVGTR